ncbi:MAG: histidine phosphatase family protein [Desulfovibrio sp.]|nr:histidine phosphatase family protein [Desulfovibrio sp.]
MKALWLARHGALPPNPQRRFIGAQDIPLSRKGVLQMRSLAAELASNPGSRSVSAICSSSLGRARHGAGILAEALDGVPLLEDPGLDEISLGAWEGLTPQEVEDRFPGAYAARGLDMAGFVPEGGESFLEVQRRTLAAVERLRLRHPEGALLLVGHAGTHRTLVAWHLALPLEDVMRIPFPYGCMAMLEGL